jgi:hypothetical protein
VQHHWDGKDSYKRCPAAGSKHIYIKVVPNKWHKFVREGDGYRKKRRSNVRARSLSQVRIQQRGTSYGPETPEDISLQPTTHPALQLKKG